MTDLTAPASTSVGMTRLGRPAAEMIAELGPLASLVGTWVGTAGFEMIAVPTMSGKEEGFRLIVRPYAEVLTFTPIGAPVPDRGGPAGDLFFSGLLYDIRISDLETNEPLHLENGMWLNLGDSQAQPIVRQGSIPHGDAFLALGSANTVSGPPDITPISGLPTSGPDTPLGYTDVYERSVDGFDPASPLTVLIDAIKQHDIVETITLTVSTENGGGITNIPFVTANANATRFESTFWLETVVDKTTGEKVQQLQYSQQVDLEFIKQFGNPDALIVWPHVTVNTMRKQ
jgi:hypothetical protein